MVMIIIFFLSMNLGVRKYNPNTYTLSGLKKVESLVAIKEEKSIHQCDKCPAKFEVGLPIPVF